MKTIDIQKQQITKIANAVSKYFGLTNELMLSKTRKREIVSARQIAQEISYSLIKHVSLTKIGIELGKQNHATVLHSIGTVNNLILTDKNYKDDYDTILSRISNTFYNEKKAIEIKKSVNLSRNLKYIRSAAIRHKIKYDIKILA